MTLLIAPILLPFFSGAAAYFVGNDTRRRALWLTTAALHFLLVLAACVVRPPSAAGEWFALDAVGTIFLPLTSLLFLAVSVYSLGFLRNTPRAGSETAGGPFFRNAPEAVFTGCLLIFLASMTAVTLAQHFGMLWVAIETTTLASAPLIYFHRHRRSLEATWKYLLICSVGIALALLGCFFLAMSCPDTSGHVHDLTVGGLLRDARALNPRYLKPAFLFLFVGYGTKMGVAPLHTWLPDAHSEAPSGVSALLSGALLNCAFVGILRVQQVCLAAGLDLFTRDIFVVFGLVSLGLAGAFILRQDDFKRMLAYSSVEHMGILSLGIGLSGAGAFAAFMHAVNHALLKAAFFMLAGNILAVYRTKTAQKVTGLGRLMPLTGALWIACLLGAAGLPPFGTFFSEFGVLKGALDRERWVVGGLYLAFLALVFVGMSRIVLQMTLGDEPPSADKRPERWTEILPPAGLITLSLALGLYLPPYFERALRAAAVLTGGA